jgi:prepilin-type N-terminal cleavage/methylation domain-containing protein
MKTNFNNKGFSIIEIIATLAVIAIGFIGVLSLSVQNTRVQYTNKNTLIAAHLAQEGLELVRNLRDDNFLNPNSDWFVGFAIKGAYSTSTIYYDYSNSTPKIATASVANINDALAVLKIDANGFYSHNASAATTTVFSRIIVTKNNNTTDATASSTIVSCLVQWNDRGKKESYQADTVLWKWR